MPRVTFSPPSVSAFPSYPETYGNAKRRCSRTTLALADRHSQEHILLVGHGLSVEYMVRRPVVWPVPMPCMCLHAGMAVSVGLCRSMTDTQARCGRCSC